MQGQPFILREDGGSYATLVEPRTDAGEIFETRTQYTAYRGVLCRHWIVDWQGSKFDEVSGGLRSRGGTIPVKDGADIAKIIQREAIGRYGYRLPIREMP